MVDVSAIPDRPAETAIPSPCVRNCCLDEQNICLGCLRSLDEIKAWRQEGREGQLRILKAVSARRASRRIG